MVEVEEGRVVLSVLGRQVWVHNNRSLSGWCSTCVSAEYIRSSLIDVLTEEARQDSL